jgi:hypothetical protein
VQYTWYIGFPTKEKLMRNEPGTGEWSGVKHKSGIRYPLIPISLVF